MFETVDSPKQATEALEQIQAMLESEVQVIRHTG